MTHLLAFVALHPLLVVPLVLWARTRLIWAAAPALVIDVLLNIATLGWRNPRGRDA